LHVRADPVVQARRTALGAVRLNWNPRWVFRMVDIDVELVESALQFRPGSCRADLWADRDPFTLCGDNEVLVWRDIGHARIGEPRPGERQERERTDCGERKQEERNLHALPSFLLKHDPRRPTVLPLHDRYKGAHSSQQPP